ncbi:MAG: aldo/keto reductase [Lentisphaerae bacterium]|jgi:aryl-alcohol dehydrogenase-like predicted oxidoreductase|nr:aldo/keto reductase [Lentisphaerota bacterium]MBT4822268.1 aldo/keto reductase [Lentisphaerota bacterium]MBT5604836.1 aldo/keto reductase [Lentisphaerota bacterium]MBT7056099.1 aldo/keto reductase [Lentisphaerota bacterium]MBT7847360.1 aldo/keto reductase [Lentisphaerota bacterium]
MKLVKLGKTDLSVSQLAMGGLFVSKVGGEFEQAKGAVKRAVELGVNYIDTAPGYLDSEDVVGRICEDIDAPLVISTKIGGRPTPFEPQNRDHIRFSIDESLRLLKRDRVDMLMIHEPDRPGQYDWWTNWQTIDGPALEVLQEMREEGVIDYLGLGGTTAYEMAQVIRSGKFDVVLTAFNYSLLWREAQLEVIPAAVAQGMGIVAGSPLQQGALAKRFDAQLDDPAMYWLSSKRKDQFRQLYALLDETGLSITEIAIRFVISNPAVHTTLMGARSAAEVESNVAAVENGPLPADILARLDDIYSLVPYRPFAEPFGLGWRMGNPASYKGPGQG